MKSSDGRMARSSEEISRKSKATPEFILRQTALENLAEELESFGVALRTSTIESEEQQRRV